MNSRFPLALVLLAVGLASCAVGEPDGGSPDSGSSTVDSGSSFPDSGQTLDSGGADAGTQDSGPGGTDSGNGGGSDAGPADGGGSLTLATVRLPFAKLDAGYSMTLYAAPGGQPPYAWAVSGLPPGLIASTDGVIAGAPSALGRFTPQVTVSDSSSPPLLGSVSLVLIVYDGSLSGAIDQSFFGVNLHDTLGNTDVIPLVGVDENPFGVIRLWDTRTMWLDLEIGDGDYDFQKQDASMDGFIAYAQANAATVIYEVGQTPGWASSAPGDSSCKYAPGACDAPRDLDAGDLLFKQSLETIVARYNSSANAATPQAGCTAAQPQCHGVIQMYELWNEPDVAGEWNPGQTQSTPDFVQLTNDAYDTIRAADPQAEVITPSGYLPWMDTTYWANGGLMGTNNSGRVCDYVSIHEYAAFGKNSTFVPEQMVGEHRAWETARTKYSITAPFADTEGGLGPNDNGFTTDPPMGDYVARYLLLNAGLKNKMAVWYTWNGLRDQNTGKLRATGEAYRYVGNWLLGAKVTSAGCLDATGKPGTFDACAGLKDNDQSTYVVNLTKPSGTAQAVWHVGFDGGVADWSATAPYAVPAAFTGCQHADDGSACSAAGTTEVGAEPLLFMTSGYALP
jgi:hypothetical protein